VHFIPRQPAVQRSTSSPEAKRKAVIMRNKNTCTARSSVYPQFIEISRLLQFKTAAFLQCKVILLGEKKKQCKHNCIWVQISIGTF